MSHSQLHCQTEKGWSDKVKPQSIDQSPAEAQVVLIKPKPKQLWVEKRNFSAGVLTTLTQKREKLLPGEKMIPKLLQVSGEITPEELSPIYEQ